MAENFRPSEALAAPLGSVAVFVLRAGTEEEALRLAKSRNPWILRLYRGETMPVPTVEEAEAYPCTERELAVIRRASPRTIAGAPEQVRDRLVALRREYGVDEVVLVTICHDFEARLRSHELLAEAFQLRPDGSGSVPLETASA